MINHPLLAIENPEPSLTTRFCDRHGMSKHYRNRCVRCADERSAIELAKMMMAKHTINARQPKATRLLGTALACLVLGLVVMGAGVFAYHFPLIASVWMILIFLMWAVVAGGTMGDRIRD